MWKFRTLALRFLREEDGVGVVEIILILVVLIGLVVIFKGQLTSLVQSLLDKAASQAGAI
jgi:Flp pilus assembly pilin Flp